jgi:hypothetical protein
LLNITAGEFFIEDGRQAPERPALGSKTPVDFFRKNTAKSELAG